MVSAFSVPKASRAQKFSANPGPGQYNPETSPTKQIKKTEPLYSFGKQSRKSTDNFVPGPGNYEPKESQTKDKKPSFSMRSRMSLPGERLNVGPGQYTPGYVYGKDKAPSFSMRAKHDGIHDASKPGPGAYEYRSHMSVRERGHDFGKEMRSKYDDHKVPGPGSYDYDNAVFKLGSKMEPSYGFGSRLMINTDGKVPGPGSYEPKKEVYSHIGGIVGKDLRDSLVGSKTPGPGNYEHEKNLKEQAPRWSLSKQERGHEPAAKYNVGPGQYEHPGGYNKVSTTAPAYGFNDKAAKLKYDINPVPGPGTYESPLGKSRKSGVMGSKLNDPNSMNNPGPGSYEQFKYDNHSWVEGSGRYSVAKDPRLKANESFVPGPGAYENKSTDLKSPRGKISFDREEKLKSDRGKNPGPGQYDLKPTFADVPSYLLPSKS